MRLQAILIAGLAALSSCVSAPGFASTTSPCEDAARAAQDAHNIPDDLLIGITRTEAASWQWTTNFQGDGIYHDSLEAALEYVRSLQAQGHESIDIGCGQINLRWNPDAFSSLEEAFDPSANLDFAARKLLEERGRVGSWPGAVGAYHSPSQPGRARAYARKVDAAADQPAGLQPRISTKSAAPRPSTTHKKHAVGRTSRLPGAIGNLKAAPEAPQHISKKALLQ